MKGYFSFFRVIFSNSFMIDLFLSSELMENSFRALNIAFIDEWVKFSERLNIDLFKIIQSIKMRDTHKNIMLPGIGVGGYCLTKDPLIIGLVSRPLDSI